jgi:hypothetical protein
MDWYGFAAMAQRVLTGTSPTDAPAAPFAAALTDDPALRISPVELMARVHREPLDRWCATAAVPGVVPGVVADDDLGTGRPEDTSGRGPQTAQSVSTARPTAATGQAGVRAEVAATTAVAPVELPDQWVAATVYAPARTSRLRRLTPLSLGLFFGLLAAVLILVSRL